MFQKVISEAENVIIQNSIGYKDIAGIKQKLNFPVLFGTTENAVFNPIFAALIAYVLLKWLYSKTSEGRVFNKLPFITFQRQWLKANLPIDWRIAVVLKTIENYKG
ncbi:hypothetical protein ABS315_24700 [Peribacillus frigoritolerans]|uniref:hypothetical protein n=1 Tax=Peribacillus frigoritolerans TaxID=450367 RepID=UPI0034E0B15E